MPRWIDSDKNNFAPRVGLAWTIGEDEQTVVRAGYGVYYDVTARSGRSSTSTSLIDFNLFFPLPGLPLTLSDPFPRSSFRLTRLCASNSA